MQECKLQLATGQTKVCTPVFYFLGRILVLCQYLNDGLYRGHPCPQNRSGQGCPGYVLPVIYNLQKY